VSGGLDSLETILPSIKKNTDKLKWKQIGFKLLNIIGRSYEQIDKAIDTLKQMNGDDK